MHLQKYSSPFSLSLLSYARVANSLSLNMATRPHDETTPPVFPRGMRLPIESADRSWRAPSLNGFNVQFATPSLPTVDMILSQVKQSITKQTVLSHKTFLGHSSYNTNVF
jgi:hypothetical protein